MKQTYLREVNILTRPSGTGYWILNLIPWCWILEMILSGMWADLNRLPGLSAEHLGNERSRNYGNFYHKMLFLMNEKNYHVVN